MRCISPDIDIVSLQISSYRWEINNNENQEDTQTHNQNETTRTSQFVCLHWEEQTGEIDAEGKHTMPRNS